MENITCFEAQIINAFSLQALLLSHTLKMIYYIKR
jgi:hypothetical protein